MGGHGVTIGDLLLSQSAMDQHLLVAPFPLAIGTGDGYYLVWPGDSARQNNIDKLALFLQKNIPRYVHNDITIQN